MIAPEKEFPEINLFGEEPVVSLSIKNYEKVIRHIVAITYLIGAKNRIKRILNN